MKIKHFHHLDFRSAQADRGEFNMKIWLYKGGIKLISKSGIGRAFEHQKIALEEKGIDYSTKYSKDYNILQLNTIFPDSLLVAIFAKIMRKKVVYYAHSTMEDFKKSFKGSDFFAKLYKKWIIFCYQRGDIIITPSEYSRDLLKGYGIAKPIINLSNGIDLNFYQHDSNLRESFRKKYNFNENDKVVISVGHYIERKGIEDFAELAKTMPEYKFIWFGFTNLNLIPNKIKNIILSKEPNLYFPGYISKEELKEAYCGSDLFLFLTHEETEGIVLLEALALEIPILIRDIPIYQNWLEDKVQVYKGNTIDEFRNLTENIVQEKVPILAKKGYEKVNERSIQMVGNTLYEIYINLLNIQSKNYKAKDSNLKTASFLR